ncbi:hypothetical protein ACROYT_G037574 [Oculina patagonica]
MGARKGGGDGRLGRGKFRPRLTQLIQANSSETVKEVTSKAFKCLPDVKLAITELTKLKAVGPATASAILCAGNRQVPFMADEAMQAIPGFGKIDYSLKFYLQYLEKIRSCLKNLIQKELEAIKKKRKFLRKSVTDTLKLIDEALSQQDNNAGVQVLKYNVASKWNDLQEVQATMCTMLEDEDIDTECASHNDYEARVIESMAKMTSFLASKHVPEVQLLGSNPPASQLSSQVQVKLPKINLPTFDGNVLNWQPYYQSIKVM